MAKLTGVREPKDWMRRETGGRFVCRVLPGADWWELDDRLSQIPGAQFVYDRPAYRWFKIPEPSLGALLLRFDGRLDRLRVHDRMASRRVSD